MSNPSITTLADPLNPLAEDFLQNPYPTYKRLQEEAPVFWSEKGKYWLVSRYADVHAVLRDLSYEKNLHRWAEVNPVVKMLPPVAAMINSRKHWMLNMDPPDHTRLRGLVNKAFTPTMVSGMREHIAEIANHFIDQFAGKKEFDLVPEYAFPLPVTVIAEMLGVPKDDRDKFKKWSTTLTNTLEPGPDLIKMSKAAHANDELIDYFREIVKQRRKDPKDDLISSLIAAEEDGNKLTEEELLNNCVLILVAGHETTVNLIGNSVRCLLQHPDQLQKLQENPGLIASAIGEVLRFESPVQSVRRLAGEDIELNGTKIKQGEMIILLLGAANRDPEQFPEPEKFDITRDTKKHLAYGHGIHHCLGSSLADTEGQVAISNLFKRLPNLKLRDKVIEIRHPFALRGAKELWLVNN